MPVQAVLAIRSTSRSGSTGTVAVTVDRPGTVHFIVEEGQTGAPGVVIGAPITLTVDVRDVGTVQAFLADATKTYTIHLQHAAGDGSRSNIASVVLAA